MLREDLLEAVAAQVFTSGRWPESSRESAFDRCFAGARNGDGCFAAGTAFALLDARLTEMAQTQEFH
jgi:hypothetical protein